MPRIVGGSVGGRSLRVPPRGTRPTTDRAREALFNTLNGLIDLDGARVLDLYAGSAAVGLEALSRGATRAVLVDAATASTMRANVEALRLSGAQVVAQKVGRFLVTPPTEPFDIVFADPPYDLPDATLAAELAILSQPGWLAAHAVVVVERSVRSAEPTWPDSWAELKSKRYGETVLWYRRAT